MDINSKLIDHLMFKVGNNHRYQIINLIIIFFLNANMNSILVIFPFLQMKPYAKYRYDNNDEFTEGFLTWETCDSKQIVILEEYTRISLVYSYNIYCDKMYTILLGILFYIGIAIGSLINHRFTDKIGRRKTIIIFSIVYNIITLLYLINNIHLMLVLVFFHGLTSIILVLTSIIHLSEIVRKDLLAIYTCIIYSSHLLLGIIFSYLFYIFVSWRYILSITALSQTIVGLVFYFYIRDSPKYYLMKNDFNKFKNSILKIGEKNNIDIRTNLDEVDLNRNFENKKVSNSITSRSRNSMALLNGFINRRRTGNMSINLEKSINSSPDLKNLLDYSNPLDNTFESIKTVDYQVKYSIIDIIKLKYHGGNFIKLSIICFLASCTYSALILNIKNSGMSIFFDSIVMLSFDLFFVIIIGFISNTQMFRRKKTLLALLLIVLFGFISSLINFMLTNILYKEILFVLARECSIGFMSLTVYLINEIFPLNIRSICLSYISFFGRCGTIFSPILVDYEIKYVYLYYILGCSANLISIVVIVTLKETYGKCISSDDVSETNDNEDDSNDSDKEF